MSSLIMLGVEGVLGKERPRSPLVPIPQGLLLYGSLCQHWPLGLCTNALSADAAKVEHWLAVQGLAAHSYVLYAEEWDEDTLDTRMRQLGSLRTRANVEMLIDADPYVVAKALHMGVTSLLFSHPQYSRPEHRPDVSVGDRVRPWSTIQAEVELQRVLTVTDKRSLGESHEA